MHVVHERPGLQYGPVCCVVWEGGAVRLLPIPIAGDFSKYTIYLRYNSSAPLTFPIGKQGVC